MASAVGLGAVALGAGCSTTSGGGEEPRPLNIGTVGSIKLDSEYPVVIYGATLAGLMAATRLHRNGYRCCVLEPTGHVGGIIAAGLVWSDLPSDMRALSGLTRDQFFLGIGREYGLTEPTYLFEPHVAERVSRSVLKEAGADVVLSHRINGPQDIEKSGNRIDRIRVGETWIRASFFIDASYEGDLMAASGCTYAIGRDAASRYDEPMAGFQPATALRGPNWTPTDNRFPFTPVPDLVAGDADSKVQAYNFRAIIVDSNDRLPFDKPDGYDPAEFAAVRELIQQTSRYTNPIFKPGGITSLIPHLVVPGGKTAVNQGDKFFGVDLPGGSWGYPDASWSQRDEIIAAHLRWQKGLFYWLANDEALPAEIRRDSARYGYPADEFTDSPYGAGFPHALYVREGRRLAGAYTLTYHDLVRSNASKQTSVCWWRYAMDSHVVQYYVDSDNMATAEGTIPAEFQQAVDNYEVPAEALFPPRGSVSNIAVPVCFSASRAAYMPSRMEPMFGMLGEAAGELVAQCLHGNRDIQDYVYNDLATSLAQGGTSLKRV